VARAPHRGSPPPKGDRVPVWLHPVSIGVPAALVVGCVPSKQRHVAPDAPAARGDVRGPPQPTGARAASAATDAKARANGQGGLSSGSRGNRGGSESGGGGGGGARHEAGGSGLGAFEAYAFGPREEQAYRASYQTARFALTTQKVATAIPGPLVSLSLLYVFGVFSYR
jgi:hypothetical protein